MFADLVPGTGSVALSVGPSTALDAATLLKALDRYPFGCSEQITSRALPLLYVNELAAEAHLVARHRDRPAHPRRDRAAAGAPGLERLVRPVVGRRRRRLARRLRHRLPDAGARAQLRGAGRRRSSSRSTGCATSSPTRPIRRKDGGERLAYALYVLARNGVAPVGDLRYIADTKLDDIATPIAKAQIAAALGLLGDKARAERVYAAALESIAPPPRCEFGRADYGSIAARRRRRGDARRGRQCAAADRDERGRARRDGARSSSSTPRRRRTPGWCWPPARSASETPASRSTVDGEARQSARSIARFRADDAAARAASGSPIRATATVQAVVSVTGAPMVPEPAAEQGLQDRAQLLHARRRAGRRRQGEAEQPPRGGAEDHRAAAAIRPASSSPTICRPASRSTIRISSRRARPARSAGSRTPRSRCTRNSATTASARRSTARARTTAVFTVAYVVRAVSPGQLRAAAGLCGGHVPARPLRPHRAPAASRSSRRSNERGTRATSPGWAKRSGEALAHARPPLPDGARARLRLGDALRLCRDRGRRLLRLDPLPRPAAARRGHAVLHPGGRPRGPPAARLRDQRRPLAAAGAGRRTSIRAISTCCSPTRTSASASHHGVDPLAMLRAVGQLARQRPHRVGRLDPHHAGGAAARAAQRAHARRQAAADGARGRRSSAR